MGDCTNLRDLSRLSVWYAEYRIQCIKVVVKAAPRPGNDLNRLITIGDSGRGVLVVTPCSV